MNLILKIKDADCTRWNKTKQKPPFQDVVCSPQGELHSKTTLALLCACGFSYSSLRFLHPATYELRCNAEFKEGVGLEVYPWVSIISGQPCISMPPSRMQPACFMQVSKGRGHQMAVSTLVSQQGFGKSTHSLGKKEPWDLGR